MFDEYIRTDLAAEEPRPAPEELPGVDFSQEERGFFSLSRLHIRTSDAAARLRKPCGRYRTLSFSKPWLLSDEQRAALSRALGAELKALLEENGALSSSRPVLVAGLGNRRMTADAVGPEAVSRITVTRHIQSLDPPLFASLHHLPVAALCPGVLGDTGIESADTLRAVVGALSPSALIAVDALAARSADRLASTIQLCDAGIAPGGGVGNDRPALDASSLGVPVFALGVPMVVDSSTLVADLLRSSGVSLPSLPQPLRNALENGKSFFVSLKEVDAALDSVCSIVASGIDEALALG